MKKQTKNKIREFCFKYDDKIVGFALMSIFIICFLVFFVFIMKPMTKAEINTAQKIAQIIEEQYLSDPESEKNISFEVEIDSDGNIEKISYSHRSGYVTAQKTQSGYKEKYKNQIIFRIIVSLVLAAILTIVLGVVFIMIVSLIIS